jgi:GntR family transcriptional regulator / MocR family aminotransferase
MANSTSPIWSSVTVQLHITLSDGARLADTLYQQLVDAIRSGQLRQGDPLPPTRQLAAQLGVSRFTVTAAYDRLAGSGYVTARVGSGTFVGRKPDMVAEQFVSPTPKAGMA